MNPNLEVIMPADEEVRARVEDTESQARVQGVVAEREPQRR